MKEHWKQIEDYSDYYVSNLSRIKSCKFGKEKILKQVINKIGYLVVGLSKKGKVKNHYVHRIVASTFIPKHQSRIYVNHKDGNKSNNSPDNLEWCSHKENILHARNTGLIPRVINHKLSEQQVKAIRIEHTSDGVTYQKDLAKKYGVCAATISGIINNNHWKHV